MNGQILTIILLMMTLLLACQAKSPQPLASVATSLPSVPPTLLPTHTPPPPPSHTPTPSLTPTPAPKADSADPPTFTSDWPPPLTLAYTPTSDDAVGRIRGRLFYPSQFIPPLAVYAVATDGSRFYRVDTEIVPPGEASYEIPALEPGVYYVYAYPTEGESAYGGAYSYLAACDAGHFPPPPEGCWDDPQYDLAPVEVRAGQAVEQVNIFDWYSSSIPPPPDDTGN